MKSKRRKIFYVALSILIAATIWFYVNNKESVTVYVHDVPSEVLNEGTSRAEEGVMRRAFLSCRSIVSWRARRLPTRASCASVGTRISPSI